MTSTMLITVAGAFAVGWGLWTLAEYLLHRFAMHHLHGKGIMSREHLEHHVHSSWSFDRTHLLSWAGVFVVAAVLWAPLGWIVGGWTAAVPVGLGWAGGYFFYEYHHAMAHLRAPSGRYTRWVRRHHFHHHFGRPMANHGVTVPWWDRVFGTYEAPSTVRVPRRLALPWMVDEHGALLADYDGPYTLVGAVDNSERLAGIDRARAFASAAPVD